MHTLIASITCLVLLAGCSSSSGTGHLAAKLTDAPGPYDHVSVVVTGMSLHSSGGGGTAGGATGGKPDTTGKPTGDPGWTSLSVPNATIDLITLQNGVELALGDGMVPAGSYDMLRLVVASASVTVGGVTSPLTIPSGSERGIQIRHDFTIAANDQAEVLLDFDANASVHEDGNGKYSMVPVLLVKRETHAR